MITNKGGMLVGQSLLLFVVPCGDAENIGCITP